MLFMDQHLADFKSGAFEFEKFFFFFMLTSDGFNDAISRY